ncbi:MAG: GNAT family N-acetyltransferase, partial [Ardenticatenaceae bacterium]
AVALLYSGTSLPVLLALGEEGANRLADLMRGMMHLLPPHFYTHLSPGISPVLEEWYRSHSHGMHYKMALTGHGRLDSVDTSEVIPVALEDAAELASLYDKSYPGNVFDPRMLETGRFYGIRRDSTLVSVAGIHVYSPRYRVAAIGNVATHPAWRGQGLGKAVCARLCIRLLDTVDHIGLNVKADNADAIRIYEKLGFERVATYLECSLEWRGREGAKTRQVSETWQL